MSWKASLHPLPWGSVCPRPFPHTSPTSHCRTHHTLPGPGCARPNCTGSGCTQSSRSCHNSPAAPSPSYAFCSLRTCDSGSHFCHPFSHSPGLQGRWPSLCPLFCPHMLPSPNDILGGSCGQPAPCVPPDCHLPQVEVMIYTLCFPETCTDA